MEEQLQAKDDVAVITSRWQRAKEKRFEMATKLETLSQKKQDLELLKEQISSADSTIMVSRSWQDICFMVSAVAGGCPRPDKAENSIFWHLTGRHLKPHGWFCSCSL